MFKEFSTEWGGKTLKIQVGKLAQQTNGSAVVEYGDTVVMSTAVMSPNKREVDFLPLMSDYEEKLYAAGKIKGSRFIKREGRPSDEAVLSGRLVDRAIRPLFDSAIRNDIQVVSTVFEVDGVNDSDVLALVAASAALSISDIPWDGPIAGARVGRVGGEWVLNPSYETREKSDLDLVVAGTVKNVIMLEAGAKEVNEADMFEAIKFAQKHFRPVVELIEKMQKEIGAKKMSLKKELSPDEKTEAEEKEKIVAMAREFVKKHADEVLFDQPKATKVERRNAKGELKHKLDEYLKGEQIGKDKRKSGLDSVDKIVEELVTEAILKHDRRVDGRKLNQIRPLSAEVALMKRLHGSSLFSRGETQVFNAVTLGAPGDVQYLDGMEDSGKKHYFHHYNFPSFSVGETGPLRGPSRRDIGHGALAERALVAVLPAKEIFPYTIRLVSEVLSSNGSSSMGSTCASSLALMDAGVPISRAVAGIAMGVATDEKGNYKIITDIQDLEDGKGGMDFKVAGTTEGITAIQMDTKTKGLTEEMVKETLTRAREARLEILEVMSKAIAAPRPELSSYAPRIITFKINPDKIRDVIGSGGKVINAIIEKTGVSIDIENDGTVNITSANKENLDKAYEWVQSLVREAKVGEIFRGKVTRLMDFGAFVEYLPGQEGLVHISQLANFRVNKVGDVVQINDEVPVKVVEIDEMGRTNLSVKEARQELGEPQFEKPAGYPEFQPGGGSGGGFGRRDKFRGDRH